MPIGLPSQVPEPKSGWMPRSSPIDATIASEPASTGSLSTRRFVENDDGNRRQLVAADPASGAPPPASVAAASTTAATRKRMRLLRRDAQIVQGEARDVAPRGRGD